MTRMNVRTRWFAGTAAAALLVVVGVACGGSNGNGEATQTSTPSPTEMAAPDAAALRALLARTEGRTFQATYDAVLTGNEVSGSGTVVLAQDGGRAVQSGNWSCGTLPGSRTDNPGRPDWTRFVCPECAHRSVRTEPSIAYTEFRILLRSLNRPRILSITSSKSDGGSWPDFVWAS